MSEMSHEGAKKLESFSQEPNYSEQDLLLFSAIIAHVLIDILCMSVCLVTGTSSHDSDCEISKLPRSLQLLASHFEG